MEENGAKNKLTLNENSNLKGSLRNDMSNNNDQIEDKKNENKENNEVDKIQISLQNESNQIPPQKTTCEIVCQFIKKLAHELFIEGFGGMAQGLFCTLIGGTIVCQIGKWCKRKEYFGKLLFAFGSL